jgi:hypothetical protein
VSDVGPASPRQTRPVHYRDPATGQVYGVPPGARLGDPGLEEISEAELAEHEALVRLWRGHGVGEALASLHEAEDDRALLAYSAARDAGLPPAVAAGASGRLGRERELESRRAGRDVDPDEAAARERLRKEVARQVAEALAAAGVAPDPGPAPDPPAPDPRGPRGARGPRDLPPRP